MSAYSTPDFPAVPIDITRDAVLAKCAYYTKVGLWPLPLSGVDPRGWLENFRAHEERHAVYLLNAFLYFADFVIDRVFVAACHGLSHRAIQQQTEGADEVACWNAFLEGLIVTAVRGERPAPTDSGPLFTRRARHRVGIDKTRILDQRDAIAHTARTGGDVLFVDDFVGTGNQFVDTFRRTFEIGNRGFSFASLYSAGVGRYFYCPVVATMRGMERITTEFPNVVINPGHALSARYSVLHPDSLIWPDDLKDTAAEFLYGASMRAGIPDDPASVNHWEGFGRQGLALAFAHGTPDATLPLLWWDRDELWTPLKGRG